MIQQVKDLIAQVDKTGSGEVSYDEFEELMRRYKRSQRERTRMYAGFSSQEVDAFRENFDKYDVDGSGAVSSMELLTVLEQMGLLPRMKTQQAKLQAMISEVDSDNSG